MRIGIDISQIVYEGTGVANYVRNLVKTLVESDKENTYILFGASLRKRAVFESYYRSLSCDRSRVKLYTIPIPPTILDVLWNVLHICPIEWFIGKIDVFWSSDWTQPPLRKVKGITTIHDLGIYYYPQEHAKKIVQVQKRRLERAKQECKLFLCDSEATKQDAIKTLGLQSGKLRVVYPGVS